MDDKITYFRLLEIQAPELVALSILGDYFTDFVHKGPRGFSFRWCYDYNLWGNSDKCLHYIDSNQKIYRLLKFKRKLNSKMGWEWGFVVGKSKRSQLSGGDKVACLYCFGKRIKMLKDSKNQDSEVLAKRPRTNRILARVAIVIFIYETFSCESQHR